jgi:hypothetical protein
MLKLPFKKKNRKKNYSDHSRLTEKVLAGFAAPIDNVTANPSVNTIGPHRSQFRNAADCCDRSLKGKTTMTRFLYTLITSLLIVSEIGSSKVFVMLPKPDGPASSAVGGR